jgi:hypothetical protein
MLFSSQLRLLTGPLRASLKICGQLSERLFRLGFPIHVLIDLHSNIDLHFNIDLDRGAGRRQRQNSSSAT